MLTSLKHGCFHEAIWMSDELFINPSRHYSELYQNGHVLTLQFTIMILAG